MKKIDFGTTFSYPSGKMDVKTDEDWKKVDKIIAESPTMSCKIFGVGMIITESKDLKGKPNDR